MKRKMKKFNEGGKTYDKEDEGILGGKIKYREDDEGRKFVAGKANPMDRNPSEQRYYSADDVKGKLSGLFGGKKENSSSSKFDELESVGGAGRRPRTIQEQISGKSEEEPRRQITDRMINKPEPAGKTFLREEADIDYKSEKKAARKDKGASDDRKSLGDKANRLPGNAADKDKKVTKLPGRGDDKKEKPKSMVFKRDIFRDDDEEPASKPAAPVVRKVVKEESDKAADTPVPKEFDMKSGNKTIYGTSTTDVFKQNEERKRKSAADKAAEAEKKRRSRPSSEEMMSQSLGAGYKRGGSVRSASARADGCAIRGKTRA
jgi:hypothetical protein